MGIQSPGTLYQKLTYSYHLSKTFTNPWCPHITRSTKHRTLLLASLHSHHHMPSLKSSSKTMVSMQRTSCRPIRCQSNIFLRRGQSTSPISNRPTPSSRN